MNQSFYLKQTYLAALRSLRKNPWINLKTSDEVLLEDLCKTLESKGMEIHDYVQFHFKQRDTKKIFVPSVKYICSIPAIQRYEIHQKMKGKYIMLNWAIDGSNFYVNKTYKCYPLSQVESPVGQDPEANFVMVTIYKDEYEITDYLRDSAIYTRCKFEYKGKQIPDKLDEFLRSENLYD